MSTKSKNTITQSDRAKATLKEMQSELKILKQDVSFKEYLGYEMCVNMFKKRYNNFLKSK